MRRERSREKREEKEGRGREWILEEGKRENEEKSGRGDHGAR